MARIKIGRTCLRPSAPTAMTRVALVLGGARHAAVQTADPVLPVQTTGTIIKNTSTAFVPFSERSVAGQLLAAGGVS